jgi:hypothetical protein
MGLQEDFGHFGRVRVNCVIVYCQSGTIGMIPIGDIIYIYI